jgi:hypothetical protein
MLIFVATNKKNIMTSIIKLKKISNLDSNIQLAHLELTLENKALSQKTTFSMQSTGTSLRLTSDHLVNELFILTEWLKEDSSNKSNLRTNSSEIVSIAKNMININKQLSKEITL